MWNGSYKLNEATAARRIVYFMLVSATDGLTAVSGETGQPQISVNGGAFTNTSDTIHSLASGHHYVTLTASELNTALGRFKVRYKSASTAEGIAEGEIVAYDPFDATSLGVTRIDAAISTRSTLTAALVWDYLTSSITTVGSIGKQLKDNVDVVLSTRSTLTAALVWDYLTSSISTVGSIGKQIKDNLDAQVSASGASAATIWNYLTSSITTVGSIGKQLKDNVDNTVSSRSSHSAADVWAVATRALTAGVNVTQLNGDTTAATNLFRSAGAIMYGTVNTSGFTPTTTAFESAVTVVATTDHFKGRVILFLTGTLAGQACSITGYSKPGSNGRFTVSILTSAPANTDAFIVL